MVQQYASLVCLFLLFGYLPGVVGKVNAQQSEDKIETDRPDQTEAATVVPKGSVQLETGYYYQKDRQQERQVITHAYPTTTVRIGILKGVEFRVLAALKDSVVENGSRRRVSGLGPVNLGAKVKLWPEAGWRPEAAVIARITLPSGNKALSPENPEPHLRLMFRNSLTEKLDLGYNLVYNWQGGKSVPAYTASLSYELSGRFTCFAEAFGQKEAGEAAQHQADAGLLFFLLPNLQLDVAAGRYLTRNAPDFFITTGLSVRLPR